MNMLTSIQETPKILLRRIGLVSPESAVNLCTAVHQLAFADGQSDEDATLLAFNDLLLDVMPDAMESAYARMRGEA